MKLIGDEPVEPMLEIRASHAMLWSVLLTLYSAAQFQLTFGEFDSKSLQELAASTEPVKLTELDCGPRCLAIVLSLLDRKPDWVELRSHFEVSSQSVSFADVKRVASEQKCVLDAVRAPGEQIRKLTFPAIGQFVPSTRLADHHFVVVLSVEKDSVRIVDPSREQVTSVPIHEFIELATGNYLVPANGQQRGQFARLVAVVVSLWLLTKVCRRSWKPVLTISSLVLFLCCGCGQKPPPPPRYSLLMVEPDRVDLGMLSASCERQARFTIRNISRRPLNLEITSRSCGCLETTLDRKTLQPDEATECVLEFRLRNRTPGTFQESATIAVPEFHESHQLACGGFVQGASVSGGSATVFATTAAGKTPSVFVDAFHMEKNCDVRVETVDITFPEVQPIISEIVINAPVKLSLGGYRRRIEIPLKIEATRPSGRGVISVAISVAGERQNLNANVNFINEK